MSRAEWDERSKKTARKYLEALSDPAVLGQFADMDVIAGGGTPESFHLITAQNPGAGAT
jgi:hypothetical protein